MVQCGECRGKWLKVERRGECGEWILESGVESGVECGELRVGCAESEGRAECGRCSVERSKE